MVTDAAGLVDPELVVELATELCRRPSMRPGEKAVAAYLAGELERLGFEVELPEVVAERPNVVAIARGDPAYRSFLFNGHSDMPPPVPGWSRDPFAPWLDGGTLHGGGIGDMKGGLAALVAGAAAVVRADPRPRGDVVVLIAMHHDTIGLGTKYFLAANDWRLDCAVCGEPTNLKVQLRHGGAWGFEIALRGRQRHQAKLEEGVNAIIAMARIVERLDRSALTFEPDPRCPYLPRIVVGHVAGGGHTSSTAGECLARGDVRYLPSMTIDGMKADLRRAIDRVCAEMPGVAATVRTTVLQRPYEIDPEAPVLRGLVRAHEALVGRPPELTSGLPAGAFITDAADLARHGVPTVLYGPGDWTTEPDEGVAVADLVTAARVYARTCAEVVTTAR
jgi:acetylornithine deacetylase